MDNKDKDLKSALDDIFGDDFIEIDTSSKIDDKNFVIDEDLENNIYSDKDEIVNQEFNNTILVAEEKENKLVEETPIMDKEEESVTIEEPKENKDSKKKRNNKKIIFIIGTLLVALILILTLIYFIFGIKRTITCSSSVEDTGYKYSDIYKITYKKNKIIYVESNYEYMALNKEYEDQIEYIRDEKIPVIINSNGMPGFTYIYESSDNFFKVKGYLDFTLFKMNEINKIDQDMMPISYFKINNKTTYKSLRKDLEKQGFTCTYKK